MREIKFRGKSHDNEGKIEGEWIYGFLAAPDQIMVWNEDNATGQMFRVCPETVGQFTGLKDKNGKEIYEGDIVKSSTDRGCVFWHQNYAQFQIDNSITDKYLMPQDEWCNYEVIGNIHESPELLEEKPK